MKITIANDVLHISFDYDPDLVLGVKAIPGRRWHSAGRYWSVPIAGGVLDHLIRFCQRAGYTMPAEVAERLRAVDAERKHNVDLSRAGNDCSVDLPPLPDPLSSALRPFQRAGVHYMVTNKKVLLGDEMGLGKTIQSLAAVEAQSAYPLLVICPASVKYNWQREIETWLPQHAKHTVVINGSHDQTPTTGTHIVIINYDVLSKNTWLWSIPWKALIVDESHYIKSFKTQRSKLVLSLCKDIPVIYLLSGTPYKNKPVELTPQLAALGVLDGEFGGFWRFVHRYCGAHQDRYGWQFDGAYNLDDLQTRLRSVCYVRRSKQAVLTELPDKTRTIIPVAVTNRAEYNRAESDLLHYLREQARLAQEFERSLEGLPDDDRQSRIATYRQDKARRAARAEALVKVETLKQITAAGKISAARDWIDNFINGSDEKLVVFAVHTETINAIQRACVELAQVPLVVTGDTDAEQRQHYIELFQHDPGFRIFIANIQAGGVGITLTAASHALFVEYAWTAADMDQAEDRLHRIGQKNATNIWWMYGMDTIDEYTVDLIEHKRDIARKGLKNIDEIETITHWLETKCTKGENNGEDKTA